MTPLCYVAAPGLDRRYRTADGWVRTGDLGKLDEQGRLHVLGRLKNVVIRGGQTISPAEVERELGAHSGLAEAVCVAVPDEEYGERLCACVRPAPGAPAPSLPSSRTSSPDAVWRSGSSRSTCWSRTVCRSVRRERSAAAP